MALPSKNLAITIKEHMARRRRLMQQIPDGGMVIIPAAEHAVRNNDAEYPFRQNSDFWYLTGFNEPNALLVLIKKNKKFKTVGFCAPKDKSIEQWTGRKVGVDGLCSDYGFDEAFAIDELNKQMPLLLANTQSIWYAMGESTLLDEQVIDWLSLIRKKVRQGVTVPSSCHDVRHIIHAMRLIKSPQEIKLMRRAADISVQAHIRAMQRCRPNMMEYQLEAELHYVFAHSGARYPAYSSIVGGGENACVLHYINNDQPLNDGDLVLIDAGCEYQNYASDITRTFPVNGRFSKEQKALYNVVLKAQLAAIKNIKPGVKFIKPHDITVKIITQGLVDLGLLKGKVSDLIKEGAYKDFYMHRAGHWLGLDVHDAGAYAQDGKWLPFEVGMALTVEPGIYVSPDNKKVAKKWRGIGIRIEDDVIVTKTGCNVLTDGVPKTVEAIEALMAADES